MFATLAICLPTEHEGGELILEHAGKRQVWNSANTSAVDLSFAAWYADVTHKVKPIASGHRLVLTYNVINDAQSRINRGVLDDGGGQPAFFCHQLSHQYTEASLKLSRLVGDDYKIVCRAFSAAESVNCMLYLATFERMISGGYDEEDFDREIIDETDEYWRLQTIVDLCGE
ncbi:hypothetical protein WHR41_01479 [Cladosporium halotolerans]|uniref:Prolyl 4-hydroxylase alpha subunit Fe(2+) 2OG dioxygenase domain-containing protein n=1 Tax=Cladosporium halotolerans TaxID=1052096 RepID=A0AB34KXE1_9PEZI